MARPTSQEKNEMLSKLKARDKKAEKATTARNLSAEYLLKTDMKNVARIASLMPPIDSDSVVLHHEIQVTESGDVHGVIEQIVSLAEIERQIDAEEITIDDQGEIVPVATE